jgi:amino acid permease
MAATYDRIYGTTSDRSAADSRLTRDLRLDWSAILGGTVLGWGIFLLLSMMGMILGLSVIDPFGVRPAVSNSGAVLWGAASAIIASFVGAFFVVRLAGDRRRGESLAHGAVSWGMSMLLAGMIALFASGIAAFSRTPLGSTTLRRGTRGHTVSLVERTGNGGMVAIFATAGAVLALFGSTLGSLAAASRKSGVPFSDEFRRRQKMNGDHKGPIATPSDDRRDETTILPPTH